METILYGAFVLVFGVFLSAAFTDIRMNKKNIGILLACCSLLGLLQVARGLKRSLKNPFSEKRPLLPVKAM